MNVLCVLCYVLFVLCVLYWPGWQGAEHLELVTIPHEPLGSSDAQTLAPDLHALQRTEPVLGEDPLEQWVSDVGGALLWPQGVLEGQLPDIGTEGQEDEDTAHAQVTEMQLLQLQEAVVPVIIIITIIIISSLSYLSITLSIVPWSWVNRSWRELTCNAMTL